jgi:hypothetical protein
VLARNDQVISQIQLSADSGDLFLPPDKMHHLLLAALLGFWSAHLPNTRRNVRHTQFQYQRCKRKLIAVVKLGTLSAFVPLSEFRLNQTLRDYQAWLVDSEPKGFPFVSDIAPRVLH